MTSGTLIILSSSHYHQFCTQILVLLNVEILQYLSVREHGGRDSGAGFSLVSFFKLWMYLIISMFILVQFNCTKWLVVWTVGLSTGVIGTLLNEPCASMQNFTDVFLELPLIDLDLLPSYTKRNNDIQYTKRTISVFDLFCASNCAVFSRVHTTWILITMWSYWSYGAVVLAFAAWYLTCFLFELDSNQ